MNHLRIAQELTQVSSNASRLGTLGRSEIDEEYAMAASSNRWRFHLVRLIFPRFLSLETHGPFLNLLMFGQDSVKPAPTTGCAGRLVPQATCVNLGATDRWASRRHRAHRFPTHQTVGRGGARRLNERYTRTQQRSRSPSCSIELPGRREGTSTQPTYRRRASAPRIDPNI